MNKESLENKVVDTQGVVKEPAPDVLENNYQHYVELGGIINEKDYRSALEAMKSAGTPDSNSPHVLQALGMTKFAKLSDSDPRVALYVILRSDVRPADVRYHHSDMTDQRLFVEALRMLGDAKSVAKMIEAYPHISFKYQRGE